MHEKTDFVSTLKGGVSLLFNRWSYHRKEFYGNGNTFWTCTNHSGGGCTGSITLSSRNEVVKDKMHKCKQDFANHRVLKDLDKLNNFQSIQKQNDE